AGAVDVGQHEDVGVVEGAGEVVGEVARAAVEVGLEDGHDAALGPALRGGGQRGGDLGGVVRVVVHDERVARGALDLEAAVHAGVLRQRAGDGRERHVQLQPDGDGGERIADVVEAGRVERHAAEALGALVHVEL